jgi:uncharacterized membrane protein
MVIPVEISMWGIALLVVLVWALIAGLAAGAVGGLLFALAASVAGALIGAQMNWSEQAIFAAQMTGPGLLLLALFLCSFIDRVARRRERFYMRVHKHSNQMI